MQAAAFVLLVQNGGFDPAEARARGARILVEMQAEDGSWGRDATFGRDPNIRASITLLCVRALEKVPNPDGRIREAIERGREFAMQHATRRPDRPSYHVYDFSFYSHAFALEYIAGLPQDHPLRKKAPEILEGLARCQQPNGGFSYIWSAADRDSYESFASGLVALALLEARRGGIEVREDMLRRCLDSIERARTPQGFFGYHIVREVPRGSYSGNGRLALEGSLARTVVCEYALFRAGRGDGEKMRRACEDFFRHRHELEKVRRRDHRTHQGEFDNAPYYFLFGHYYLARGLEAVDRKDRARWQQQLERILAEIREPDGSWFDSRICGKAYGTAMGLLILDLATTGWY